MGNNKLLIDEYPLMLLPKLAQLIGLNKAIVLQQVHYWLQTFKKARATNHFHGGRWWVFNAVTNWQRDNFPFWSEATIKRILQQLRDDGLLLTGNFNKKAYDKTLWYTIDYDAVEKLLGQNDQMVKTTKALGHFDQMDLVKMTQPIPETTTETTTSAKEMAEGASPTPSILDEYERTLTDLKRDGNKKAAIATARAFYLICFGEANPPSFGYVGKAVNKAGSPGYFCQLCLRTVAERPSGDPIQYIMGILKRKGRKQAPPLEKAASAHGIADPNDPDIAAWLEKRRRKDNG